MPTTLAVFSFTPIVPYHWETIDPAVIATFAGSPLSQRASTLARALRRYALRFRVRESQRLAIQAFFDARRGPVDPFYWRDPLDYQRTLITPTPATSDGATVNFAVPVGSPYGGDYPIDDANALLYRAGVLVSKTVDTDGRKMVAGADPADGAAMTMSYWYYRRVKFESDRLSWRNPAVGTFEVEIPLIEDAS